MTAREDILQAISSFEKRTGERYFRVGDILQELTHLGIPHNKSTIQTHIVSAMCVNAPQHHAVKYPDLFRIDRGLYRLANTEEASTGAPLPDPSITSSTAGTNTKRNLRMADQTDRLIQEFTRSLASFDEARLFTGPSVYFHERTVRLVSGYEMPSQAVAEREVAEAIYATLTAWGMHRMGPKGAKLPPFADFEESLARTAPQLDDFSQVRLDALSDTEVQNTTAQLWEIIEGLRVSATASKLVAGSKALHHLLPKLMPPIDRQYTGRFFFGSAGKNWYMGEETAFLEIFPQFVRIARQCSGGITQELDRPDAFLATSASKIVDNAIVGYVISHPTS